MITEIEGILIVCPSKQKAITGFTKWLSFSSASTPHDDSSCLSHTIAQIEVRFGIGFTITVIRRGMWRKGRQADGWSVGIRFGFRFKVLWWLMMSFANPKTSLKVTPSVSCILRRFLVIACKTSISKPPTPPHYLPSYIQRHSLIHGFIDSIRFCSFLGQIWMDSVHHMADDTSHIQINYTDTSLQQSRCM